MKREEIIRDLVERSSGAGAGQYISIRCDVAREIVALLNEKEARVMTWEEVKKSGSAYRCVEIYSPQVRRLTLIYCIVRQSETSPELYYLLEDSGVSWCRTETEYNRDCWKGTVSGWRCWTSRPTEEQRKAAKWG